jgi:hypothetical protein
LRLSQADASILLSDEGRVILSTVDITIEPLCWLEVDVVESEDLGLWIRAERDGSTHLVLVRWEYILAVDLIDRLRGTIPGLKGMK